MLTDKQKKELERICYKHYKGLNPTHNIWHLKETSRLAVLIAKKEKANIEICKYGAMLHQFHDGSKVEHILERLAVDNITRKQLVHVVYCASSRTINQAKTKEAKIVNDADKLQCLGGIGIMRQVHDFSRRWELKKAIKKGLKEQNLFYKQMKTKTAKKLAKQRYKRGLQFYKEVLKTIQ